MVAHSDAPYWKRFYHSYVNRLTVVVVLNVLI